MKLSKLRLLTSKDFIKPILSDLKIGDLVFYYNSAGKKCYCLVAKIIEKHPVNRTKIYGRWYYDRKSALEVLESYGYMYLEDIFKVI